MDLRALALAVVVTWLSAGCSSVSPPDKFYDGPDLPDNELVILDWSSCDVFCQVVVDGKGMPRNALFLTGRFPIKKISLRPGVHAIEYHASFGYTGPLYTRQFYTISRSAKLDMRAGHHYVIRHQRTAGWGVGNVADALWLEDKTTGEILEGRPPSHRRELVARSVRAKADAATQARFALLTERAHCGDSRAQVNLAFHYFAAVEPVAQRDVSRAYFWYSLAAQTEPAAAERRQKIAPELSAAERAQAEELVMNFQVQPCPVTAEGN